MTCYFFNISPLELIIIFPPLIVIEPSLSISSISGSDLIPSLSVIKLLVPSFIIIEPSDAKPLFAASIFIIPEFIIIDEVNLL